MYVDTLDADEVVGTGINAMLRSLDPYTIYYPEEKVKDLNMMISGKYAGIGAIVRYNMALQNVVIDEPYEKMPAAEVGLRKGDIILSIDDSTMGRQACDLCQRARFVAMRHPFYTEGQTSDHWEDYEFQDNT